MGIESIVQMTISTTGPGITRKSFGIPLILGYHDKWPESSRVYSGAEGLATLLSEGFTVNDPVYIAAQSLLAPQVKIDRFVVGKLLTAFNAAFTLSVRVAKSGQVYAFVLKAPDGSTTDISYTALPTDGVTEIATAINSQINAVSGISATSVLGVVTVAADNAGEYWR